MLRAFAVALACATLCLVAPGCTRLPQRRIEFIAAPAAGDVAAIVKDELSRAQKENKRVLVYVGATWCEPCKRFHHAVEAGQLDGQVPNLRLVEFDSDRDSDRLTASGYQSRYIPLFALPGADGRSTQKQIEGSIKGEGAVAEITPRLQSLIAGNAN